jgi:hypothetical protein
MWITLLLHRLISPMSDFYRSIRRRKLLSKLFLMDCRLTCFCRWTATSVANLKAQSKESWCVLCRIHRKVFVESHQLPLIESKCTFRPAISYLNLKISNLSYCSMEPFSTSIDRGCMKIIETCQFTFAQDQNILKIHKTDKKKLLGQNKKIRVLLY